MNTRRVALLRGGDGRYFDASYQAGRYLLDRLSPGMNVRDVFVHKNGEWYDRGVRVSPESILRHVDVVFHTLYGGDGESGAIQSFLETLGIRYVGTPALSSSFAHQKRIAKRVFADAGLVAPTSWLVRRDGAEELDELILEIRRRVPAPWVVKPATGSYSEGVVLVWDPLQLVVAVERALFVSEVALIEEFVKGDEVSVLLVEDFRDQELYAFFPAHIHRKTTWDAYDRRAKRSADRRIDCPSTLSHETKQAVLDVARRAHRAIGARDFSQVGLVVTPSGGCKILEIDTVPELGEGSPVDRALTAAGVSIPALFDHLVGRAISRSAGY